MFATALAYGLDIDRADIEQGLRTFANSFFQAPGRLNVYDELPFRVIMDYAHNAHGVHAMTRLTDQLAVKGKRIAVIAAPGDRRDQDIIDIGRAAAGHYDVYICKRDDHTRGRRGDEVPGILRQSLIDAGVDPAAIEVIEDEQAANQAALERARAGDLVVIFVDQVARTWKQIIYFKPADDVRQDRPDLARSSTAVIETLPGSEDYAPVGEVEIRQDERGVYIAPEESD
jgi:cyanophycin synthetase